MIFYGVSLVTSVIVFYPLALAGPGEGSYLLHGLAAFAGLSAAYLSQGKLDMERIAAAVIGGLLAIPLSVIH